MKRILLSVCWLLACALAIASPPINIIIPSTPGGAPDLMARTVAEILRVKLQAEVLIQYVPGANGELAIQTFLRATPESNSLLVSQDSVLVISPHLYRHGTHLPQPPGQPLAYLGYNDNYILLRGDHQASSLDELLLLSRKSVNTLFYGSGGVGTLTQLVAEKLSQTAGVEMLHVPYKSNTEALLGLLRGDVEMIISGSAALPMLRAQRIKAIAVIGTERSKLFPALPRVADSYPEIAFNPWFGVLAQPSAGSNFINTVSAALKSGLQDKAVQLNLLEQGGITAQYMAPPAFSKLLEKDYARYGALVGRLNLQQP